MDTQYWTFVDERRLYEYAGKLDIKDIAKFLGRTQNACKKKLTLLRKDEIFLKLLEKTIAYEEGEKKRIRETIEQYIAKKRQRVQEGLEIQPLKARYVGVVEELQKWKK